MGVSLQITTLFLTLLVSQSCSRALGEKVQFDEDTLHSLDLNPSTIDDQINHLMDLVMAGGTNKERMALIKVGMHLLEIQDRLYSQLSDQLLQEDKPELPWRRHRFSQVRM